MVFNRQKDKFKVYRLKHTSAQAAEELVDKINSIVGVKNRNYAVFINPISGNGKSQKVFYDFVEYVLEYSQANYSVFEITDVRFFERLNLDEILEFTNIIVLGGDGTMHLLLTALKKKENLIQKFEFSIIPTGSSNVLAVELYGKSINTALLSIVKGTSSLCDLIKVTLEEKEMLATSSVSWGLISDLTEDAQQYRIFGPYRYRIIAFLHICQPWKSYSGEILTGETKTSGDFLGVLIGNHSAKMEGNEIVYPKANIKDGLLDTQIVDFMNRWDTGKFFRKVGNFGKHVNSKKNHYIKGKTVTIIPKNHFIFNVDGEIYYSGEMKAEVIESAIKYLVF